VALSIFMLPFSPNPAKSLWSSSIRMTGVMSLVYLWVWFIVLHSVQRRRDHWTFLVWFLNAAGVLVSAIAILEFLGGTGDRTSATLDNPIFLASFSTLCLWLAIWLVTASGKKSLKIAAGLTAVMHLLAVMLSGTRASGLAVFITGFLGAGIFLWRLLANKNKKWLAAIAVLAVAGTLLWTKLGAFLTPPFIQRFSQVSLGADRLTLWLVALEGFFKRPLTGWGPENFEMVFDAFADPTGINWLNTASWNDRVHNQFLEILVGQGGLGFVAYTAVWVSALWFVLSRGARKETARSRSSSTALFLLLVAHAIQICFSFDTPVDAMVFTLALALIGMNAWSNEEASRETSPPKLRFEAALILALFLSWYTNLQTLGQAAAYRQGEDLFLSGSPAHHETIREAITESSSITPDLRLKLVDLLMVAHESQLSPPPEWAGVTKLVAHETIATADLNPLDHRSQLAAAEANRLLGPYDPSATALAVRYAERALRLAPQRSKAQEALGEAHLAQGNLEQATEHFHEALKLTRSDQKNARVHFRLCETLVKAGRTEAAALDCRIAHRLGHDPSLDIRLLPTLVKSLEPGEVPEEFIGYLENLDSLYRTQLSVMTAKSIIYAKAGYADEARLVLSQIRSRETDLANSLSPQIEQLLTAAGVN